MSKRAIVIGFSLFFCCSSIGVLNAQTPAIAVYFDTGQFKDCPGMGVDTLAVVGINYPNPLCGAELAISYPLAVAHLSDILVPGTIAIGSTVTGITISWTSPAGGFQPLLILEVIIAWLCEVCEPQYIDNLICPVPNPNTGFLGFSGCTSGPVPATGICAGICHTNPTEKTSWGKVKALYNK